MPDPPTSIWSSGIFQAWHRHQFQCQSHPRTPINLFEDAVVVFFYGCDGVIGLSLLGFHHRIPSSLHRKCPLEEILSFCSHNIVVGDGFTRAEPVWLPLHKVLPILHKVLLCRLTGYFALIVLDLR